MYKLTCLMIGVASIMPFGCPSSDTVDPGTATATIDGPTEATVGQTIILQATATAGAEGRTITYSWYQKAGRGVQILDADTSAASFVAPSMPTKQDLTFVVSVRDSEGATARAEHTVTVNADANYSAYDPNTNPNITPTNTGPTADAGADSTAKPGNTVQLDGSKSRGSGLTYAWRQVGGRSVAISNASSSQASFVAPDFIDGGDNLLRFELVVTDRNNRAVTDRVQVTVTNPNISDTQVRVETTMGSFVIELYPDKAPATVANFLQYVDDGFYDGTIFHRVIAGFVVQGGGFTPGLNLKTTRDPIVNESSNGLKNDRTTVAMARTSDPNSATSQWFVNLVNNDFLNRTDASNPGYCVFGHIIEGMDVIDTIATVQTGTVSGYNDVPLTDVIVNSAKRVTTN